MNYLGVSMGKLLSNALEIGVGHADSNGVFFFGIFSTWLRFCPVKCELKIFWITDIFYYNYVNCFEKSRSAQSSTLHPKFN